MGFSELPTELLLEIINRLDYESELNALHQTDRHLYSRLNDFLYQRNVSPRNTDVLRWAATQGSEQTARKALVAGAPASGEMMLLAAKHGHAGVISVLHEHGRNVNLNGTLGQRENHDGWVEYREYRGPPMELAIEFGRVSVVQELLRLGAAVQRPQRDTRRQPLAMAAVKGNLPIVEALIERGAALEAQDVSGATALDLAVLNGHVSTVKALIDAGSVINGREEKQGETPLEVAVSVGCVPLVKLLVEAGCKIKPDRVYASTKFPAAALEEGHVVELLGQLGVDLLATQDGVGNIALPWAASHKQTGVLQYLLDHGVQPTPRALFAALASDSHDGLDLLLSRVDVEAAHQDPTQQPTIVCAAAARGHCDLLQTLIDKGWDVTGPGAACNRFGSPRRPLEWAVSSGQARAVRLLLLHLPYEADVTSSLHAAVTAGHAGVVSALLHHGADPNHIVDDDDEWERPRQGPILYHAIKKRQGIFEILLNHGANPGLTVNSRDRITTEVILRDKPALVRILLERGVDFDHWPTSEVPRGVGLLRVLMRSGEEVMQIFLDRGFDAEIDKDEMVRALHIAILRGNIPLLRFLISKGLDVCDPEKKATLLFKAASGHQVRAEATVDFVLDQGVDIDSQTPDGRTPLMACISRYEQIQPSPFAVRILLERGANPVVSTDVGCPLVMASASKVSYPDMHRDLLRAIDAQGIPFEKVESQLLEAISEALKHSDKAPSVRLLRRYYWRKRHPVPELR